MSGNNRNRSLTAVLALALVVALASCATTRGHGHAATRTSHVRTDLIAQAKPRPGCPNAPTTPKVHSGQKLITVVRIVDHCLAFRGEVVASTSVPARLKTLRADP